jgi:hypothetical protein
MEIPASAKVVSGAVRYGVERPAELRLRSGTQITEIGESDARCRAFVVFENEKDI